MSWRLDLFSPRGITADEVEKAFAPNTVSTSGDKYFQIDIQGASLLLERESVNAQNRPQVADFINDLIAATRRNAPLTHWYAATAPTSCDPDEIVEAMTRLTMSCDGVLADIDERQTYWPETTLSVGSQQPPAPQPTSELLTVVQLDWYVRATSSAPPMAAWLEIVAETMPESVPVSYGLDKIPMSQATHQQLSEMLFDDFSLSLWSAGPIAETYFWDTRLTHEDIERHMTVGCRADLADLDGHEMERLRDLFVRFAQRADADLATAQVLPNWSRYPEGFATPYPDGEPFQTLRPYAKLLGVPAKPVWWCWFGPKYVPFVEPTLTKSPRGWQIERHGESVLVSTSPTPATPADLAKIPWFPRELRVRRGLFLPRTKHPAKRRPVWDS